MTPWRHLSVGARLLAGFSVVLLIAVILVMVGLSRMTDLHHDIDYLVDNRMESQYLAEELRRDIFKAQQIALHIILTGQETDSSSRAAIDRLREKNNQRAAGIEANLRTDEGQKLLNAMQDSKNRARPLMDRTLSLALSNQKDEARQFFHEQAGPAHTAWVETIEELVAHLKQKVAESHAEADAAYHFGRNVMLALAGLALLLGASLAIALARSITQPLNAA